jgi:hypothetical protein
LSTDWETLLVTRSSVWSDILESLDIASDFSTEITFDDICLELLTDEIELRLREFTHLFVVSDPYLGEDDASERSSHSIYIHEGDFSVFGIREIYSSDTSHRWNVRIW